MIECDVLIVGAGPAGSVAALYLSQKGFDVVLLEKQSCVGAHSKEKIDITEDLGLVRIIRELNLPVSERTNVSHWFTQKNSLTLKSRIQDLYIKRGPSVDSFEVKVTGSAVDKGTNLILGSEVEKLNYKEGRIDSVIAGKEKIKFQILIAADGFDSRMLKELYINEKRIATIAGYGVMAHGMDLPEKETYIFLDRESAPGGYFFAAKTCDGEGVACVVVDKSMTNKPLKEYYEKIVEGKSDIKKILKDASIKNEFSGMSHSGILEKVQSGNVLLTGDAARTLDPLLGYGMRNTILSAYTAAETASDYLETENIDDLKKYQENMLGRITNIQQGLKMRQVYKKLDNCDFDHIVKTLKELQESGVDLDEINNKKSILAKTFIKNIPANTALFLKICLSSIG